MTDKTSQPNDQPALSDLELEAINKSSELALLVHKIIGDGPNAYNDWLEATIHIHAIQNQIMSQAAARAYPDRLRLLGQKLDPTTKPNKSE